MLLQVLSKIGRKNGPSNRPTHATQREDHFRRKHEELCRQARHEQYFYGWRTKCD